MLIVEVLGYIPYHLLMEPCRSGVQMTNSVRLHLGACILFQIIDFNYEFIMKNLKMTRLEKSFSNSYYLIIFITMVNLTQIQI